MVARLTSFCLFFVAVSRSIDDTVSFPLVNHDVLRRKSKIVSTQARSPKAEDTFLLAGDVVSLSFFGVVQSIVDPLEPSFASLFGGDAVADYRLDVLANPLVASAVVVPCWLVAGLFFSDAYVTGASARTVEESLANVLRTYLWYLPCVTIALALSSCARHNGVPTIAAPDFTFCAGAISIVGSWRFTLASTIGR